MHAHKIKAVVGIDHEVHVKLPSDFPPGEVEVIVLRSPRATEQPRLSVDELIAARLPRPATVEPVSLEAMEQAIREGGEGRGKL